MLTKLKRFTSGESKLSEQNIRSCLVTFLRNSPKLEGQNKKAVTAIQKMHPHHGDGSHKGKDEVDGGRQKTVIQGFEAMIQATGGLDESSPNQKILILQILKVLANHFLRQDSDSEIS